MKRKLGIALASSLIASFAMAAGPHWEYDGEHGPKQWGAMDPAFKSCGVGKRQSPINIETDQAEKGGLKPIPFSYVPGPAEIVNNGHTIQVNLPASGGKRCRIFPAVIISGSRAIPGSSRP